MNHRQTWLVILCFACIYLFWGGTFLAIKFAIVEVPPITLSGVRFALAGAILLAIGRLRREPALQSGHFKMAALSGSLLVFANSMVCVAEQWLSSGTAAIIVGSIPVWIMLVNWFSFDRVRPTARQVFGIVLALLAIALLTRGQSVGGGPGATHGVLAIIVALVCWTYGTLLQRRAGALKSVFTFSGAQLFTGGLLTWIAGAVIGPPFTRSLTDLGWPVVVSFIYLVVFGSVIAFTAYLWLSSHVSPSKVSTYAVVNPLVAVWLGWWLADERLDLPMILLSLQVLVGLGLVVFDRGKLGKAQ